MFWHEAIVADLDTEALLDFALNWHLAASARGYTKSAASRHWLTIRALEEIRVARYADIETAPQKREAKMIDVQTAQDGNSKPAPARPLGLFITVVRDKGGTDEVKHIRAFKALLNEEGYEDFRDAVIDEWARIKYSTAFAAANPPTASELRQRLEQQKREREEERKAIDAIKFKIVKRALLLVMPNGKQLGCCTGA